MCHELEERIEFIYKTTSVKPFLLSFHSDMYSNILYVIFYMMEKYHA